MNSILDVKDLTLNFEKKILFKNLNFKVQKFEKVSIVGASGTGKSTLFNSIMGFMKPKSGEIFFEETLLSKDTIALIRNNIAWLPQNLDSTIIVRDFIDLIFNFENNRHISITEELIEKNFDCFKLDLNILKNPFNKISGGEKQRVLLIVSLLLNRKLLLLDEPVASLDNESKNIIINYILKNDTITVLSNSHDKDWINCSSKIIDINK